MIHNGIAKQNDFLSVANVWSLEKEKYLDYRQKHDNIRALTLSRCSDVGERLSFLSQQMQPGENAKSHLLDLARLNKVDIIVVGYHGRKGPKEDPTIMGTAVQYMGVTSSVPILIVKELRVRSERPNGYHFAACVDGSKDSLGSLDLLCDLQSGRDRISVLIYDHESIDA
jgi:hypothetical protein